MGGSNPRVFGCTAFNNLMREQTHECNFVVGTAKEIYALNPAEFKVFTPDTQDSEIMHPDVFETHLRSHVNLMSGTIGVKTIEGAFRNLVNAISPVLPNYIASGDHQEKNASFFVHEFRVERGADARDGDLGLVLPRASRQWLCCQRYPFDAHPGLQE